MTLQPFSDEQLNFLKFSFLVLNEFPKALRKTFKTMWDINFGHQPGSQLWDDSTVVRNLFAFKEGGKNKVPIHQSYNEWDCNNLFQATIYAQSFAQPASTGSYTTLYDLYVKPRGVPHVSFHTSVLSPCGNSAETFALAIDQLRRLRNLLCHSASSEMDKATFDRLVNVAKDAFQALGVSTTLIDAVGSLTESDFPINEVRALEMGIRVETCSYIKFLEEMSSDISELKALLIAIKNTREEDTENIAILEQKIFTLKEEQDKLHTTNNHQYTTILEGVKSDINVLKQKVEENTASKEDITRLEKTIIDFKDGRDECDAQGNNSGAGPWLLSASLPSVVPNFTGRQSECKEVIRLVTNESTRLVSIWGSPGFGKTSVAIAVGHALQSQGRLVYWISLRGLHSKADLTSKFLSFVRQRSINNQPSIQRLSNDDVICQLFSEISKPSVFILDNGDDLLESGCPKAKEEVLQLLEEILMRNQIVTFVVTTRESLDFLRFHFKGHQCLRIRPLDEASAQTLVYELLPNASATDRTQIAQICGKVPLAMKLMCSSISEESAHPRCFLDNLMRSSTESIVEMLDNPDYPASHRLQFLFDSSFQRLTAQQQDALISLSILPEHFSAEVAAAVTDKAEPFEAQKILRSLLRKSLIDSSSKQGSFTMHKLLQSFAREKGEKEMKETILNAKSRLEAFYISHFKKLNEQFLTGHSMEAYTAFYEDKESIVQSLVEVISNSKAADSVFEILVKGEFFLDFLFWSTSEAKNFDDIYDSAIKASKLHGKSFYRQLLASKAFSEVTWGRSGMTKQLLSKASELQAAASRVPNQEKGKCCCYLGIYYLVAEETMTGIQCLKEALLLFGNCSDPEQKTLKLVIFQILFLYYQSRNDFSSARSFYDKALHQCRAIGDSELLIVPSMKSETKKATNEVQLKTHSDIVQNQPLKCEIAFLVSKATKVFADDNTRQYTGNFVLHTLEVVERKVEISRGFLIFHEVLAKLLLDLNVDDPVELYISRIKYHQAEIDKRRGTSCNNDDLIHMLNETLAKCYFQLGKVYGERMNHPEALQVKQRALDLTTSVFGEDHECTADCKDSLAITERNLHDYTSSLQSHQHALAIRLKLFGEKHESTADSYSNLGVTQFIMHDYAAALQSHQRALAIRLNLFGEEHASTADSYSQLGLTQNSMHDYSSALQSHQRALAIHKSFGEDHERTADSYRQISITQLMMQDYFSALQSRQRALAIRLNLFGQEHESVAESFWELGVTQCIRGDYSSSLQSHQCALAIHRKLFGEENERTADSYWQLGLTQSSMRDYTSALQSHQRALAIRRKLFGEENEITADSYRQVEITQEALREDGKKDRRNAICIVF